jgi:hypothetical protein
MNDDHLDSYAETLARLAEKDHDYYIDPAPTRAHRAAYARRQKVLELMRSKAYPRQQPEPCQQQAQPGTFTVEIRDQQSHKSVVSAPLCYLKHDLTNYIGVIAGFCDLLSERSREDPTALRYISNIRTAVEKTHRRMRSVVCTRHLRVGMQTSQNDLP